ncbi:hypothetical protein [Armatimonas sp.]|uniref:esterase/lipase family protein n=1 Tax=Armatimonas sp. TaxID=1872638 RepID=UPI00286A973F|nr:hypothetical protein [Armatimonas sp.]
MEEMKKHVYNRRQFLLVSGASTATILAGCGGGGGKDSPLTGRTVTSNDGKASLIIPDGVISQSSRVELTSGTSSSVFTTDEIAGMTSYDILLDVNIGVANDSIITIRLPFDPSLKQEDLLIYIHDQSQASPVFASPDFSGTTASTTVLTSSLIPNVGRNRAVTKRVKVGIAKIVLTPKPGNVNESLYSYQASAVTGQSGSWILDSWRSFTPSRGKRLAIIIPGTFTRRDNPLHSNEHFHKLTTFLSTINNTSSANLFFDGILGFEYDDILATPAESGRVLAKYLNNLLVDGVVIYLFAHSQGGLVSRLAIEHGGASDVTALFMFGTPNQGIPTNAVKSLAWLKDQQVKLETGADSNLYRSSSALEAMTNGSSNASSIETQSLFLKALNNSPRRSNSAYYAVFGRVGYDIPLVDADSKEIFAAKIFSPEESDGVVFRRSSRGEDINLSNYSRINDGWDTTHSLPLDGVSHSNLPNASTLPEILRTTIKAWLQGAGERINLPANIEWMDTNIDIPAGAQLLVEAVGIWTHGNEGNIGIAPEYGPDGWKIKDVGSPFIKTVKTGALIGKIGNEQPFLVGSSFSGTIATSGRFFVTMNDDAGSFSNNDGELTLGIRVKVVSTSRAVIQSELILVPLRKHK